MAGIVDVRFVAGFGFGDAATDRRHRFANGVFPQPWKIAQPAGFGDHVRGHRGHRGGGRGGSRDRRLFKEQRKVSSVGRSHPPRRVVGRSTRNGQNLISQSDRRRSGGAIFLVVRQRFCRNVRRRRRGTGPRHVRASNLARPVHHLYRRTRRVGKITQRRFGRRPRRTRTNAQCVVGRNGWFRNQQRRHRYRGDQPARNARFGLVAARSIRSTRVGRSSRRPGSRSDLESSRSGRSIGRTGRSKTHRGDYARFRRRGSFKFGQRSGVVGRPCGTQMRRIASI